MPVGSIWVPRVSREKVLSGKAPARAAWRGRDLYYLGMSQLQMSQDSESRNTLQEALSAGLEEPMSTEARATVAELKKRAGL
jgi:hypothetical protein